MARPLRIEMPGGCYHVINRGNFRFPVLQDAVDLERLLEKLVVFADLYQVRVRAYCLMASHFHLHVQTGEANLGRFMQSLLTSFSVGYNRRHATSGHVFQGRYKAYVVEDASSYRDRVSRYIHLNPARVSSLADAATEVRQRAARDCAWSSYGAIIGLRPCPSWLDRDAVLRGFAGRRLRDRQRAYATYVEQGLTEDLWDPAAVAVAQTVIGSDSFVDRLRRAAGSVFPHVAVRRECGQQAKLGAWCALRNVVLAVAGVCRTEPRDLLVRWSRGNDPRQILLYMAAEHCRGRYTLSGLARRLGGISVSGLARAHGRIAARLKTDRALRATVQAVSAVVSQKSTA